VLITGVSLLVISLVYTLLLQLYNSLFYSISLLNSLCWRLSATMSLTDAPNYHGYRPKLIDFHGYEGEDFRNFKNILENYFSITNVAPTNPRRLSLLNTQLRRSAATFLTRFTRLQPEGSTVTYDMAMDALQQKYITPELIQRYELAFNDMVQGEKESPQIFLSRLYEAAELAEIDDDNMIHSRFRAGLQREIRLFCIQCSSKSFNDWVTHADGWWNANKPIGVSLVDNPFVAADEMSAPTNSDAYVNSMVSRVNQLYGDLMAKRNVKDKTSLKVDSEGRKRGLVNNSNDPTMDQLAEKLKALELHHLAEMDPKEINQITHLSPDCNPGMSEAELVNIIKRTIKEELKNSAKSSNSNSSNAPAPNNFIYPNQGYDNNRFSNNRRRNDYPNRNYNQREDHFDNDSMNPPVGYYPNRRPYNNNNNYNNRPMSDSNHRNQPQYGNNSKNSNNSAYPMNNQRENGDPNDTINNRKN
jgi:hypothetical protein